MDGLCYDVEKGGESMKDHRIAGPLLRLLRLQRNWSQETLCHGICTVSYILSFPMWDIWLFRW